MATSATTNLLNSSLGIGGSFGSTPVANSSAQMKFQAPKSSTPTTFNVPTTTPKSPTTPTTNTGSSSGGTSGYQYGGWYGGRQWNGSTLGPVGQSIVGGNNNPAPSNNNSGPSVDFAAIDSAFQPEFDALNQMGTRLNSDFTSGVNTATQEHDNQAGTIGKYTDSLNTNIDQNQNQWNTEQNSAYASALKAYRALQQRNAVLYGGDNGAAEAANLDLQDQWGQQQQNFDSLNGQASLAFKNQNQDVAAWGTDQHAKLDNWLLDAKQQLQSQLSAGLSQIDAATGAANSDKAKAKLGLVTTFIQHQQEVADLDTQFRRQVQLAMATMPQGGQFDQSGFLTQMNSLGQSMSAIPTALTGASQVGAANAPAPAFTGISLGNTGQNDPYAKLLAAGA